MNQIPLLRGPHLPSIFRYEALFAHLPTLPEQAHLTRGRKPYDQNILLRALIYRCLRQIPTLTELTFELENNPSVADCLGLDPMNKLAQQLHPERAVIPSRAQTAVDLRGLVHKTTLLRQIGDGLERNGRQRVLPRGAPHDRPRPTGLRFTLSRRRRSGAGAAGTPRCTPLGVHGGSPANRSRGTQTPRMQTARAGNC